MKTVLAFTGIVLLTSFRAQALIGESLAEFTARYGAPGKDTETTRMPGHEQFLFEKDGMIIECVMGDGKCVMEVFHRRGPKITDHDITDLLKAEEAGHTWGFNRMSVRWMRSDHQIEAYRQPGHDDFFFIEKMPDKTGGKGADSAPGAPKAELAGLRPAMSWQGAVVHPSWVVAANKERVVFGTTETRQIAVPLAAIPANVMKQFEAEIRATQKKDADAEMKQRLTANGAAAIFGRVLRRTENGVLVTCGSPEKDMQFPITGGEEKVPLEKVALAGEPGMIVLLRNLPNEAALVDNDPVCVVGFVKGTWQYTEAPRTVRTVRVYSATNAPTK